MSKKKTKKSTKKKSIKKSKKTVEARVVEDQSAGFVTVTGSLVGLEEFCVEPTQTFSADNYTSEQLEEGNAILKELVAKQKPWWKFW